MPRQPRQLGETGYLHLIVRGNAKQVLFEDEQDYRFFLRILEKFCLETLVKVCAYCLMENHVHLLAHDEKQHTPLLMKKLCVTYAIYYNRRYERSGHLFQDRYLSENIGDDAYFLTAARYILNNPYKAGICEASRYPWSSYAQYDSPAPFVEVTLLHEMLGGWAQYVDFIAMPNNDLCLEYDTNRRDDAWAMDVIHKCLGVESGTALLAYERSERDEALRKLKDRGLTVRQIERLTGINRGIIQRVSRDGSV